MALMRWPVMRCNRARICLPSPACATVELRPADSAPSVGHAAQKLIKEVRMFTRNWPRHLLCLSLGLPLGSAPACGPDFPMRLLDSRDQSLSELPEGNFRFEVSRLGQAIAGRSEERRVGKECRSRW